jgi:hypothetical protein
MLDARPARAQPTSTIATDLEVVTVTDTSVIVTWSTLDPGRRDDMGRPAGVPTDGELRIAAADGRGPARTVWAESAPTPYHYAEARGLEPGRAYRFEAYSHGIRATPALSLATARPATPESTGRFTTLTPPPGRHLRTIALANDVHFGEHVSGIIAGDLPPGFRQEPGLPPYPAVMLDAMLADLRAPDRGADHLIVAGDLTAEAEPADAGAVRARLDSWGRLDADYLVCRGNHDRPHHGSDYARCPVVPSADGGHDCWGAAFGQTPGRLRRHEWGGLRVIGLDTVDPSRPGGVLSPGQLDELRAVLADEPERPTLVFGHHPVTLESAVTNLAGPDFVLDRADAAALQSRYGREPGVFFHHSGHTHRNRRTHGDPDAAAVEFLEVGAVKEYPGGYTLLRLHEGGYQVNFYKTRSDLARRWSARSRGEYFGLFPEYTLGSWADRNHVVLRDLSGLEGDGRSR